MDTCRVVPFSHGLIVDGMSHLVVLRGADAIEILPAMIPLMDGNRTVEDIRSSLSGCTTERVLGAISVLAERGLIEEGPSLNQNISSNQLNTVAYLRRQSSALGKAGMSTAAASCLTRAAVILTTSEPNAHHANQLAAVLRSSGLQNVRTHNLEEIGQGALNEENHDNPLMVALAFGDCDREWLKSLNLLCVEQNLAWLRIAIDTEKNYADLGPLFLAGETPCYRCFTAVHGAATRTPLQVSQDHLIPFWIGIAANEIIYQCVGVERHAAGAGFRRYLLSDWTHKELVTPRLPGCELCRIPFSAALAHDQLIRQEPTISVPFVSVPFVYDEYMAHRLDTLAADGSGGDFVYNPELPLQMKQIPTARHWALSAKSIRAACADVENGWSAGQQGLTLDDLSILLQMTAGLRLGHNLPTQKRWSATAGNLGSVELFVVVRRVLGVEPGTYYYEARTHSLARLNPPRNEAATGEPSILALTEQPGYESDALFVFTAAHHRVRKKYGSFAYRLIHLDAGVAMSQLRLVASFLRIYCSEAEFASADRIRTLLYLDPDEEQITGAIAICKRSQIAPDSGRVALPRVAECVPASAKNPSFYCGLDAASITALLLKQEHLPASHNCQEVFETPLAGSKASTDPAPGMSQAIPLPSPTARREAWLPMTLESRRSVRSYTAQPVLLKTLSDILSCVRQHNESDCDPSPGMEIAILIFSANVIGLERGLYTYRPDNHHLVRHGSVEESTDLRAIYVQPEFALAPLHIFLVAKHAAVSSSFGVRGYAKLLTRLGETIHMIATAALFEDLRGTIVAGLRQTMIQKLFGLNGYSDACVVAYAAGYTAEIAKTGPE
ncbi:MAG TPA: SagB family peptide dehydrogenase [Candidatus Angelobacter sp.]|nr:SagB family peptide dehydrogenase [Candidatus Angelobacter sp.]